MHTAELVGYLASALVFATFYMKTMMPLRAVAIASNVAFISYGYVGGMAPIPAAQSFFQRGARPEQPDQGAPDQPAKIAHRWNYQSIRGRQ